MTSIAKHTNEPSIETSASRWGQRGWRFFATVGLTVFFSLMVLNDCFYVHDIFGRRWLLDGAVGGFSVLLTELIFLVGRQFRPTAT
jgi:hypothetical protein